MIRTDGTTPPDAGATVRVEPSPCNRQDDSAPCAEAAFGAQPA